MIEDDAFVRLVELPWSIRGLTVPNNDGTYTVYINSLLPEETQRETLAHELYHIEHDHLYDNSPVTKAECAAGGVAISANDKDIFEWLEANKSFLLPLIKRAHLEHQIKCAKTTREERLVGNGYARSAISGKVLCIDIWKDN